MSKTKHDDALSCVVFFSVFFSAPAGGGNMYDYAHFSSVVIVELDKYSVRVYLNFGFTAPRAMFDKEV